MKNGKKLWNEALRTIAALREEVMELRKKVYRLTEERNNLKGENLNLTSTFNRRMEEERNRMRSIAEAKAKPPGYKK